MNRRYLVIATTLIALLFASATAQEDNLLQRYDLAIENLDVAVASVPSDGLQARDELERALNALLTLSTNATSPTLVQAMERTFDRTRVAIENQSSTDMAVQTSVLAGGFGRLVMDSAFTAAASGDTALARTRLVHLATHLGFADEDLEQLQEAATAPAMRLAFEAGTAEVIALKVQAASELASTDQAAAYERLAAAYGESLLVQDSPRVGPELNRSLVNAANALVAANAEDAADALQSATTQLANLANAARGQAPGSAAEPAGDETPDVVPAVLPSTEAATEPADGAPEEQAEGGDAAAAEPEAAPAQPATDDTGLLPLLSGPDFETAVQQRLDELEEERRAATLTVLNRDLTRAGVPAALAQDQATNLLASGYSSLEEPLAEIEALTTRIVAAQRSGDVDGARAGLSLLRGAYQGSLAPVLRTADPELGSSTEQLIGSLQERFTLTSHDVSLLATQTSALRASLLDQPAPAAHDLELAVDSYWSGYTRVIVLILLALLAIVPLVLLNLAFGGSNRNWRLVGWALFLLLITVFFEGLVALAGLVGHFANLPFLTGLATWSVFSSTISLVVWAVLVFIALLLAIVGLYGICVQFGLLGSNRQRAATTTTTAVKQEKKPTGSTTIDWDEEF